MRLEIPKRVTFATTAAQRQQMAQRFPGVPMAQVLEEAFRRGLADLMADSAFTLIPRPKFRFTSR